MIYQMGHFSLDTDLYRLSCSDAQVQIEPQVFDLLVYLIEHRDRVIPRDELIKTIWKGRVVSDSALSASVKAARRAFGDSGNKQSVINTVHGRGYQFIAEVSVPSNAVAKQEGSDSVNQESFDQCAVRYVASKDGVSIAYADVGDGYPLVFSGSWMTHLEQDWQNPMARHFLTHLSRDFRIIRYDQRGIGMSDWENVEFSIDRVVDDLECVIDSYDYDRVAILGASQGACVAISYAVRHPERVSHLILHGGYARGRRRRNDPAAVAQSEALTTLIRQGWASTNPAFRQLLTTMYMPDATPEEANWFNNFQKTSSTAENMGKVREMYDEMDVSALLDHVQTPTLVIHCSGDTIVPISEGKFVSSRIRGSEFVLLESDNHMILETESDYSVYLTKIRTFLAPPKSG